MDEAAPAALVNYEGSGDAGAFRTGTTVSISAFKMAKYETTWELYEPVKNWAVANGYNFFLGVCSALTKAH